jgi:hypothetical protein
VEWDPEAPAGDRRRTAASVFRPDALVMDERGAARLISIRRRSTARPRRGGEPEMATTSMTAAEMAGRFRPAVAPLHLPIQHPALAAAIVAEKVAAGHVRLPPRPGRRHGSILSAPRRPVAASTGGFSSCTRPRLRQPL